MNHPPRLDRVSTLWSRNWRGSSRSPQRVVLALGGNALLRRGTEPGLMTERSQLQLAIEAVATVARDHTVVLTHGNGPQVGQLALRAAAGGPNAETLDVVGAETEGMIGYLLERELRTRLPDCPVVTLLTQVQIDPSDPALTKPTKPIGQIYERVEAEGLRDERGWTIAHDGSGWRRTVPSPLPQRFLELDAITLLMDAGHLVVCGGGGGIPVVVRDDGTVEGIEAVIDKDRSAALLAAHIGADLLVLLTDVGAIYRDWPQRDHPVGRVTPLELGAMGLPEGSMLPKAEAAAAFVMETGRRAAIGALEDAAALVEGTTGTQVVADG